MCTCMYLYGMEMDHVEYQVRYKEKEATQVPIIKVVMNVFN